MKKFLALTLVLVMVLCLMACTRTEDTAADPSEETLVEVITSAPEEETVAESYDLLFAMGNSDVPVGSYTQKIFAFYGIDEAAVADHITYGTNVKEVTTAVVEGTADCGVVYATDAYSAGLSPVDYATAEMCGQVIYPAAVMKSAKNAEAAQHFLTYLTGSEATAAFEEVGFTAIAAADVAVDAADDSGEVIVFAAASMTETLTKIAELYKQVAPNVTLTFNFDSSGTLKTQIEEGADCDLFISASPKQMNQLDITADAEVNTDGLDFVASETRFNLLENKVVLCVAENSACGITGFDDLAAMLLGY